MATSTTTSTTTAVTTKDMKSKQLYLSMPRIPPKVYLKTVNPHITCNLCKGYLIDATTIVECLHSFCHSCIMMHLRRETYCPSCEMMINKVKPNIKPDATLQAIVYKLVPGLYEKELLRRRAFYKLRTKEALEATPEQRGDDTEHLIFGPNESISLMLEYSDNDNSHQTSDDENSNSSHEINSSDHCDDDFEVQLRKPKYLQCPAIFTISNLKKFLLHKFSINPNKFCVEIMYKVKSLALPDHYTLMDVAYIFTWKRDAPMKFLYCVRAAHLPVANIEQSAVMYDLPPNRFQANTQLACASDSTDQEQDQSSDADSEARSDRPKEPVNGTVAQTSQDEPINSTSDEPSSAPSSSSQSMAMVTSNATVTSTSLASTSSKSSSVAHASVNGSDDQKKDILDKVVKESVSSPTTSNRLEIVANIKTERLSVSPEKQQPDRKSNGASPKPNTSKSRSSTDVKPSVSPTRTNQDLKDSKEKVKTKSIMLDSVAAKLGDVVTLNRCEPKTVTFSDKPSPSARLNQESKSMPTIDRSKGRLLFNKDEEAKSLSPPLSAENEYDFDQHLLKEKLSEKKKFLSSIHLTPRIPSTDPPLVQLPKMPKIEQKPEQTTIAATNLSKEKDNSSKTTTTVPATTTTTVPATTTTTTTNAIALVRQSVSSSSPSPSPSPSSSSLSSGNADKQAIKKPENKISKRKSREPVKNVAKVKCVSPNDRTIDTKWDTMKPANVSSMSLVSTTKTTSPATTTLNSSSSAGDRIRKILQDAPDTVAKYIGALSQSNKNHLKTVQSSASTSTNNKSSPASSTSTPTISNSSASKSVFKTPTPTPSSSKESASASASSSLSTGLKQPSTSESETSIIINNVQRPNQADTPRPSMSYKPNVNQQQPFYFSPNRSFSNETEIQEIRNDVAQSCNLKVYGPAMGLPNSIDTPIPNLSAAVTPDLFNYNFNRMNKAPIGFPFFHQLVALQQLNNLPLETFKTKPKKPTADGKKPSASLNFDAKMNALQKGFHPIKAPPDAVDSAKQQMFSSVLTTCRIPSSLSITLTNDESEPISRSLFNTKNSNVVNTIEILKLPDESGAEVNAKFPSPSSSASSANVEKARQSNKNANNNPMKLAIQQNNQNDSLVPPSYQEKFLQSLKGDKTAEPIKNLKKPKPPKPPQQKQLIRPNIIDELNRNQEAQKRKLQPNDDKTAKVRRLQQTITQHQKTTPTTQRPVPDLLVPKDDKKMITSNSGQTQSSQPTTTNAVANSKTSKDRQSPTVSSNVSSDKATALTLAVAQAQQAVANEMQAIAASSKYSPLQTSKMPIWATHCTADQMASHKVLEENLTQSKKNYGTFVD